MRRAPFRLALGELPFDVYPDGRVLVTLPPTLLPFGVALQATVLCPSLGAFLTVALPLLRVTPSRSC